VNPDFTPVTVFFVRNIVDGLEGNTVVVCASAIFPVALLEGSAQVAVDVSVLDQGSAGIKFLNNVFKLLC
jgi:hypothetical protein